MAEKLAAWVEGSDKKLIRHYYKKEDIPPTIGGADDPYFTHVNTGNIMNWHLNLAEVTKEIDGRIITIVSPRFRTNLGGSINMIDFARRAMFTGTLVLQASFETKTWYILAS